MGSLCILWLPPSLPRYVSFSTGRIYRFNTLKLFVYSLMLTFEGGKRACFYPPSPAVSKNSLQWLLRNRSAQPRPLPAVSQAPPPITWPVLRRPRGDGTRKPAERGKRWRDELGPGRRRAGSSRATARGQSRSTLMPVPSPASQEPAEGPALPSPLRHPPASFLVHL